MPNAPHLSGLSPSRAAIRAALRYLIGNPGLFRLGAPLLRRAPRVRA